MCEEVAEEERGVGKGHMSKGLLYWTKEVCCFFPLNIIGNHWIRFVS